MTCRVDDTELLLLLLHYTRLMAYFPGQPGSAGARKVKPVWI